MLIDLFFIAILLGINAVLTAIELSVLSIRKSRLKELAEYGDQRAKVALSMLEEPTVFLASVQTYITLVTVLASAIGGGKLSESLSVELQGIPTIGGHANLISFFIVVVGITYLTLIIGELLPKRLAVNYAEEITVLTAKPISFLIKISRPLVWLFSKSTDFCLKFFGAKHAKEKPFSEEEIAIVLAYGKEVGVFEEQETAMIERVFKLDQRSIDLLMTPRGDIFWIDLNALNQQTWRDLANSGHSYFPVCRDSLDNLEGVIGIKDLWKISQDLIFTESHLREEGNPNEGRSKTSIKFEEKIESILKKPLILPGSISAFEALEQFKKNKVHFAIVINEHGTIEGLITINDLVQVVMGEMPALAERSNPLVVERQDGSHLIDGLLPFDDFKALYKIKTPQGEEARYKSLAGFILDHLGHFPEIGERFECYGILFEIVDMDRHKIDRVLTRKLSN
ncbi:MAG TPA: hemolysin family protein [Oligoflexia bacterium]|nr:hemolysin family protein [Oligoflexia bacterium]HMP26907.1 hemolysin family protein [Oligoflexia bacterium]